MKKQTLDDLDKNELLPFCMRCFGIGVVANETSNFCHQCGSEGTCLPVKRKDVYYMQENIDTRIEFAIRIAKEQCKKDIIKQINRVCNEGENPHKEIDFGEDVGRERIWSMSDEEYEKEYGNKGDA